MRGYTAVGVVCLVWTALAQVSAQAHADSFDTWLSAAPRSDGLDPRREPVVVLVDTTQQRLRILVDGKRSGEDLQIGLGQTAGCKIRQGDLKTPCGTYFVTGKSTGPFKGDYAAYYGGHFIKLNYPNADDAERGQAAGLVTEAQKRAIADAWRKRALTPQSTRLGGGIGFHGWADEWPDVDTMRGSWGCITLHNRDIASAYARIPVGAMVVLF